MKNIFAKLFIIAFVCVLIHACKKDEVKTVMTANSLPAITLSPSTVVLTDATADDSVQTISWSKSDYGFSAAVNYTVILAKAPRHNSSTWAVIQVLNSPAII